MNRNSKKNSKRHPLRSISNSPVEFEPKKKYVSPQAKKTPKKRATLPELTTKEIHKLKGEAHSLKPLVIVGDNGITKGVIAAINDALDQHELIKVKMRAPEDKKAMAKELSTKSGSILVGLTGHVVILFRPAPEEEN